MGKIKACITRNNFPLNTPQFCNAILMCFFYNRAWVPFSRLFRPDCSTDGKAKSCMSSAANPYAV